MGERIQTYSHAVVDDEGVRYRVSAEGAQRDDGIWEGWLVFEPLTGDGPTLRTSRETTQPKRKDLAYWASGLEPIYFEGALGRAKPF